MLAIPWKLGYYRFTWWTVGALATSGPLTRRNRPARGELAPALEEGGAG